MRTLFVGLDDTDAGDSIGTGALARELQIALLRSLPLRPLGITRHQLLVDPRIPYTSHNSAACLAFEADPSLDVDALFAAVAKFIALLPHEGADPGVCVGERGAFGEAAIAFGRRAQVDVVARTEAETLADAAGVRLRALGGTGLGVIGALAACGLRATDDDGRFLSRPGCWDVPEVMTVGELRAKGAIARVLDEGGRVLAEDVEIRTQRWIRPDLVRGEAVLQVESKPRGYTTRKKHDAE